MFASLLSFALALPVAAEPSPRLQKVLRGHTNEVMGLAFLPDGKRLVTGSDDGTVRLWNVAGSSRAVWGPLDGGVNSVAAGPAGALSGDESSTVVLWDPASGKRLGFWKGAIGLTGLIAVEPAGRALAAWPDGTLRLIDARAGKELAAWRGADGSIKALASAGSLAYSGDFDGFISAWSLSSRKRLIHWRAHQGQVIRLAADRDGRRLASTSADGFRVWDPLTGRALFSGSEGAISAAFSFDGKRLVIGGEDGVAWIWDAETGMLISSWTAHPSMVVSVAFSPDGTILATGGWDGTLRLWSLDGADAAANAEPAPLIKDEARALIAQLKKIARGSFVKNSDAEIALGRRLFFDRRLSRDKSMSCSSCHKPEHAFDDGLPRARGVRKQESPRNTPSLLGVNTALYDNIMWDGRLKTIEQAALSAIQNPIELDVDSATALGRLRESPEYIRSFRVVYGGEPTWEQLGRALGAFSRSVAAPKDSPFDLFAEGRGELDDKAARGFILFAGRARCMGCHMSTDFTDNLFHSVALATGPVADKGRGGVSGVEGELGIFRTPTLRDVARTGPYMHDGRYGTLREVIDHFDRGGDVPGKMAPLRLSEDEKKALEAFLLSLTSSVGPPVTPDERH